MKIARPVSRLAVWAFGLALLLKAAVPMLASASAHLQGKNLVEICTAYGVVTIAVDGAPSSDDAAHEPGQAAGHGGDHCVLTALLALGAPGTATLGASEAPTAIVMAASAQRTVFIPDAAARWAALLGHGPPALS